MKKNMIIILAVTLLFSHYLTARTIESQLSRSAVECTPRHGFTYFFKKTQILDTLRIAYFGGSITEQAGWRVKSFNYLKELYPKCKFVEINGSIGGTGSDLGVLRIEHDVLSHKPDLLFVEFAVNDAMTSPDEIAKSMEGIVRKTKKICPACDICFVYTLTDNPAFDCLKEGKLNQSAAAMEMIADYYHIPSIHLGLEVIRLLKEGRLIMKANESKMEVVSGNELNRNSDGFLIDDGKIIFSKDGVHPLLNTGHQLYFEAIQRSLPIIQNTIFKRASDKHILPLFKNNYENSKMIDVAQAHLNGNWDKLSRDDSLIKPFNKRVDSFWKASVGSTLTVKFKGSYIKLYDLLGPEGARIEMTIDDKTTVMDRFDGYCRYWRLSLANVAQNLKGNKIHKLTIKVLSDTLEKRAILFDRNKFDYDNNPSKYSCINWYVGAIFIDGEILIDTKCM